MDADAGAFEIWTPEDQFPHVESAAFEWTAPGASTPLVLDVRKILLE